MGITPQGLQMALRTFDGDLLPDGALIGLLQPSPNLTLNAPRGGLSWRVRLGERVLPYELGRRGALRALRGRAVRRGL